MRHRDGQSHGVWVIDATAVVIINGALYSSKYNLENPYPDIVNHRLRSSYPFRHVIEVVFSYVCYIIVETCNKV